MRTRLLIEPVGTLGRGPHTLPSDTWDQLARSAGKPLSVVAPTLEEAAEEISRLRDARRPGRPRKAA